MPKRGVELNNDRHTGNSAGLAWLHEFNTFARVLR